MRGRGGAQVDGAKARLGTNLFAVVDGVGLQVVADVVHDEVCGNVAQLPAPTVSAQSVTKINSGKGLANYKIK